MNTREQYKILKENLNERQWRIYLGTEAVKIGFGGISQVARMSGASRITVRKGAKECKNPTQTRIRKIGGGRKKLIETDSTLVRDLEKIIEPKGDPTSLLQWTTKSLVHLMEALRNKGHSVKRSTLAEILYSLGFSLKGNKKNIEGISHPDRDLQFKHIKKTCDEFEKRKSPIISVDCKKKELIGNFKNNGKEWKSKGTNQIVNVYDFLSLSDGKAAPYGVYDVLKNEGFVNVGTDHDTASFAVESIRRWWNKIGVVMYGNSKEILINSDGGGSNGVRNRLWKKELQEFSDQSRLNITVNHLPPATSKWNKIEHRLFSYISINWRGKPITSLETIIELLSNTKTKEGLTVIAMIDKNIYSTGIKVTDEEMSQLNIVRDEFHGEWNYTISPRG